MFLNTLKIHLILFLTLLGIQLSTVHVFAANVLEISPFNSTSISLTEYFAILEDSSATLTLTDIQTPDVANRFNETVKAEALNYGITRSAYWFRLTLQNNSDVAIEQMLELSDARLSSVQFYQPTKDNTYQSIVTGMKMPFSTRAYKNRYFVFPILVPPHSQQTYYLRIQSIYSLIIPAKLWTPSSFHRHERDDYLVQAWYFGIVSAMILFNFLLFIILRDMMYFLYITFATCFAFYMAALNGLGREFLWTDTYFNPDISSSELFYLAIVALLVFIRRMLNTQKIIPKVDVIIQLFIGIYLLQFVICPIDYRIVINPPINFLHLTLALLLLSVAVLCSLKRQRSAYFFLSSFFMFFLGGLLMSFRTLGILPTNDWTVNGFQFGSAIEMLLLAFALADRFNMIRKEKEKTQADLLQTKQQLVENLQAVEHILETRVAERTAELQIANRKLEALSTTDGLTGIANRRRFDEILERDWNHAMRLGQPLALALLDVDWFKKYNDYYGHQMGDECLKIVANVLATTISRSGDLVARYGGEEFVFIAPNTDGLFASNMANKICKALQMQAVPHEMSDFGYVTASIGVAVIYPREWLKPDILLKTADEALYQAKEQGRNRVVHVEIDNDFVSI